MWRGIAKIAGGLCVAVGAIAAALEIVDFWQLHTDKHSEQRPPAVGELPKPARPEAAAPAGADSPISPGATETRTTPHLRSANLDSLLNRLVIPKGANPTLAIALDGDTSDVEVLEAAFSQGIPSGELRVVPGLFKPAFKQQGLLRAVYDGDTETLAKTGALAAVDRVLVGRVERSCRETGQVADDLVTCDLRLHFKTIDRQGAISDAGHLTAVGAGFSEEAARDRAAELLVQQHGKRVMEGS